MLFMLAICCGVAIAWQSAVNARLRSFVQSPFLTALISFSIGTAALICFMLLRGELSLLSYTTLVALPPWLFVGGLLGVVYLTINTVLFKKIGGVQTAVLPIFGQLVMSTLIDQFGLIYAPLSVLSWQKVLGLVLVVCGVVVVTDLLFAQIKAKNEASFIWKAVGVIGGMLSAIQAAVNGHLGSVIGSPLTSATISFIIGTLFLILLVVVTRAPLHHTRLALKAGRRYWWIWLGGLLGVFYVFGIAFAVPKIGTGQVIVCALFGQLLASAIIEHFGLFDAVKKTLSIQKACALAVMLAGVILVKL